MAGEGPAVSGLVVRPAEQFALQKVAAFPASFNGVVLPP
jgi:hypothetical protein